MTASLLPTLSAQVAFGNNPYDASPTWVTPTSATVAKLQTGFGRQTAANAFQAGTATLTFDDFGRELDPTNSSSAHSGDLLPNKQVRVRATIGGHTYPVWQGFVNQWPTNYIGPVYQQCAVTASDAFKLLSRATLPDCPYAAAVAADSPSGWWRFGETFGTVAKDSSGNGNDALYQMDASRMTTSGLAYGTSVGALKSSIGFPTSWAVLPINVTGTTWTIEFSAQGTLSAPNIQFYPYFAESGGPTVLFQTDSNGFASFQMLSGGWGCSAPVVLDNTRHLYTITVTSSGPAVYVDGELIPSTVTGFSVAMVAGAVLVGGGAAPGTQGSDTFTLGDLAIYTGVALTATQVAAHYDAFSTPRDGDTTGQRITYILELIGVPAGMLNVDGGLTALGPASWSSKAQALTYAQLVETTEQGELFVDHPNGSQIRFLDRSSLMNATSSLDTLSDDGTTHANTRLAYESVTFSTDDQLIYNEVSLTWVGGTVVLDDATSQTTYGLQANPVSQTLLRTASDATAVAQWLLGKYDNPGVRILSVVLNPVAMPQLWPVVLSLTVGERITLRAKPSNTGAATSGDYIVESIAHNVDVNAGTWAVTLAVRPPDITNFWKVGSGHFGDALVLAL